MRHKLDKINMPSLLCRALQTYQRSCARRHACCRVGLSPRLHLKALIYGCAPTFLSSGEKFGVSILRPHTQSAEVACAKELGNKTLNMCSQLAHFCPVQYGFAKSLHRALSATPSAQWTPCVAFPKVFHHELLPMRLGRLLVEDMRSDAQYGDMHF